MGSCSSHPKQPKLLPSGNEAGSLRPELLDALMGHPARAGTIYPNPFRATQGKGNRACQAPPGLGEEVLLCGENGCWPEQGLQRPPARFLYPRPPSRASQHHHHPITTSSACSQTPPKPCGDPAAAEPAFMTTGR